MTRYALTLVLLCLFAGTLAAPAFATVSIPEGSDASAAWHADGTPCPDENDDDHGPCRDGCPCHCCHHSPVFALWLPTPTLESTMPDPVTVAACGAPQAWGPNGYLDRIFRPPRG